jgi:pyruvate,water dikinase
VTAGFLSPYDVETPAGAEGWEEMYPYYVLFDPARREQEENRFWFYNGMHFPEPMPAFDMITAESCYLSIGLYHGRVFSIPTVLGIEHRVVNGYVYITSNETSPRGCFLSLTSRRLRCDASCSQGRFARPRAVGSAR